jgi:hypothetical protein
MSHITSPHRAHLFLLALDASHPTVFASPSKTLTTCSNLALYAVRGHLHYTWPLSLLLVPRAAVRAQTECDPFCTCIAGLADCGTEEIISRLAPCRDYTKLYHSPGSLPCTAYCSPGHLPPLEPADVHKTAVITPFGHLKMPFGLHNAAQTFQRFIDTVE